MNRKSVCGIGLFQGIGFTSSLPSLKTTASWVGWLLLISIGISGSLPAFAGSEFPNLNDPTEGLAFRKVLERALSRQKVTFTYEADGRTYKYYVSYGEGYVETHAHHMIPRPLYEALEKDEGVIYDKVVNPLSSKITEFIDVFPKFLREKGIYKSRETHSENTREYSFFILAPRAPKQPFGTLQGPYFTFTLTALHDLPPVNKSFLDESGKIKGTYYRKIGTHVKQLIVRQFNQSPRLSRIQKDMLGLQREKERLFYLLFNDEYLNTIASEVVANLKEREAASKNEPTEPTESTEPSEKSVVDKLENLKKIEFLFTNVKSEELLTYAKKIAPQLEEKELIKLVNYLERRRKFDMLEVALIDLQIEKLKVYTTEIAPTISYEKQLQYIQEVEPALPEEVVAAVLQDIGPVTIQQILKTAGVE